MFTCRKDLILAFSALSSEGRKDLILAPADATRKDLILACTGSSVRPRTQEPTSRWPSDGERVRKPDSAPASDSPHGNRQELAPWAPDEAPEAGAAGLAPAFLSVEGPRERWRRPPFVDAGAAGALSCLYLHASPYLHVPLFFP